MVINGIPALACNTFVDEVTKTDLVLEPLSKFPVVADLVVDRSIIYENLNSAKAYIEGRCVSSKENHAHQYAIAKCLKCGLCLEACPNYTNGHSFLGAAFANDCYLVLARNREKAAEMRATYARSFGNACSKSLACMDVCPMDIPTIASMARLNRL
jgi:succinate dehydrogenase / fumarate reductase iron-sulfur subunit